MDSDYEMDHGRAHFVFCILILALVLPACSHRPSSGPLPEGISPGTLMLDILQPGQPELYWQYEVQPSTGMVRLLNQQQFADSNHRDIPAAFHPPVGVIDWYNGRPEAASPDGRYLAYCKREAPDQLYVLDTHSTAGSRVWKSGQEIRGFAWSPNSASVAVLTVSGHVGLRPSELLAFVSGHPVSHDTVYLAIVDARTAKATEYPIRRDVIAAFTRILSWTD